MAPAVVFRTQDLLSTYLAENVWVPILAISAAVILVIIIVYCVWRCRHNMRYDYSILRAELALPQKLEMERRLQYDTMRETALLHCQFYLRSSGLYTPVDHLTEIGSRMGKHWFLVRDNRSKVEKLLTMVPRGPHLVLPFTSTTRNTLLSMLQAIQHPYIYPIYDLDLLIEQDRIVVIQPHNSKGSLKDVIYHAHCLDSWSSKYYMVGAGLTPTQVAKYGRQILEGMIFLQKSGFPPLGHLHSGNIIVQNNTCRITGYENDFIGLSPKMYGMTTKPLRDDKVAIEVICFGHIIYEMSVGNELDVTVPELRHLSAIEDYDTRECLEFIFSANSEGFHTLEQISEHPFFQTIALKELEVFKRPPVKFSKSQKSLLKAVKKGRHLTRKKTNILNQPGREHLSPRGIDSPYTTGRFQLPSPMDPKMEGSPKQPYLTTKVLAPTSKSSKPSSPLQEPSPPSYKPPLPSHKPSLPASKSPESSSKPPPSSSKPKRPTLKPLPPELVAAPCPSPPPVPCTSGERTALLSQIRQGTKLKRIQTVDRNAPRV